VIEMSRLAPVGGILSESPAATAGRAGCGLQAFPLVFARLPPGV
jgi:hypothetical protein